MKRLKKSPPITSSILDHKYINKPQPATEVNSLVTNLKKKPTHLLFLIINLILVGISIWALITILTKYSPSTIKNVIIPAGFLPLILAFLSSCFFSFNLIIRKSLISLLIALYLTSLLFLQLQLVVFSIWLHGTVFFFFLALFLLINFPIWMTKK